MNREWCIEHDAPPARYNDSPYRQCIELVRRLERQRARQWQPQSFVSGDEPYDCQFETQVKERT